MYVTTYETEMSFGTFSPVPKIIKLECSGHGTELEPFIITGETHLPKFFRIENSNHFVIFQNSKIITAHIKKSQNISFDHSQIKSIGFVKCKKCSLKDTTITYSLTVKKCSMIEIQRCTISKVKITKSKDISLDNNEIKWLEKSRTKIIDPMTEI